MNWPAYEAYRPSTIDWLGDIPSHWSNSVVGRELRELDLRRGADVQLDLLSVSATRGVVPRTELVDDKEPRADDLGHYKVCLADDIVVNRMSAYQGALGIARQNGIVSPDYMVLRSISDMNTEFLAHLFKTPWFVSHMAARVRGIGSTDLGTVRTPRINAKDFRRIQVALPPCVEQDQIVAFVDCETAKIDALIAKQEQLIATLREDRTATITYAVNRGLDSRTETKASGVEWIGVIPEHWIVTRLGRLCRSIADGPHFSPSYVDNGLPFLSARNVKVDGWSLDDVKFISEDDFKEFSRRVVPEVGDVLYTKGGTTGIARAVDLIERFQVWVHIAVLKLRRDLVTPEFLAYALNSSGCYEQSQLYTRGATNQDLGLTRMVSILLALPPLDEQCDIVEFLDKRCDTIDTLIAKAETMIDTLREYRAALITDAVTGKIDVRGAA